MTITTLLACAAGPPGANLFVYHIPPSFTDADLAATFQPFGALVSAKVYVDRNTGESKGFGKRSLNLSILLFFYCAVIVRFRLTVLMESIVFALV